MNLKLDIDFCDYEVKFVTPYTAQFAETGWNVSASILVDDADPWTEDIICAIDTIGNDLEGFYTQVDDFHTLIHETIPILTPF